MTTLRQQYHTLITQLKDNHRQLDIEFRALETIELSNADQRLACSKRIAQHKSEQRKIRKKLDSLMNTIFDVIESPSFETQAQLAEAHLKTMAQTDKIAMELKSDKVLRNVDNKLKQDAMAATLREVWSVNTFPIFQAIAEMDSESTINNAQYYAQLALHQYVTLNKTLRDDDSDDLNYTAPVWSGENRPVLTIDDIESMTHKIITKVQQRQDSYRSLCEKYQQEPTFTLEQKKHIAVKIKKRRSLLR